MSPLGTRARLHAAAMLVTALLGAACERGPAASDVPTATDVAASDATDTPAIDVAPPTLESLAVAPRSATCAPGATQSFTATARYSDGSTEDVTTRAAWTSSNTATATIDATGTARCTAVGTTTIRATLAGTTSADAALTVRECVVSITVSPVIARLVAGTDQIVALRATATYCDGTFRDITELAMWTSSAPTIASVSNTAGMRGVVSIAGPMTGTANITATLDGMTSLPAVVDVSPCHGFSSIAIMPTDATIGVGASLDLTAIGTFYDMRTGDLTTRVPWTTSDASVATVGAANGHVTAIAPGRATIQIDVDSCGVHLTATSNITVTAP